jgi:very-short-patch-repair endonuclease
MPEETMEAEAGGLTRVNIVARILKAWRSQLIDVSAANRLLNYSDYKVAVVDLAGAAPPGVSELLAGRPVRATRLWPDTVSLASAIRSLKAIRVPAREYEEEFGLRITYIASGFATWTTADGTKEPCAPVLLRPLSLRALPGSVEGFELEANDDPQLNPVLLHVLEAEHGVVVDDEEILEASADGDEALFARFTKSCLPGLPGFRISARSLIANFVYASQSMVADLGDDNVEFLAQNDMIAALAGDPEATDRVQKQGRPVPIDQPDHCPPSDEHLILDADGSQSYVINSVAAGHHLVVQGPPGTGKTQTITNTVADLVARGKTVLFVAQKRAAITSVLDRLHEARLDGMLLDLFDGASSRRSVVQQLGAAVGAAVVTGKPLVDDLHAAYGEAREVLVAHHEAMHGVRDPWGMSLLGSKDRETGEPVRGFYDWATATADDGTEVRLDLGSLSRWGPGTHERARRQLGELFDSGGLDPDLDTRPGWAVAGIPSAEALQAAEAQLTWLTGTGLSGFFDALRQVLGETGAPVPSPLPLGWCASLAALLSRVTKAYEDGYALLVGSDDTTDSRLDDLLLATGSRGERRASPRHLGVLARRRLRADVSDALSMDAGHLHRAALDAQALRHDWRATVGPGVPSVPQPSWARFEVQLEQVTTSLGVLRSAVQGIDLDSDLANLAAQLDPLRRDRRRQALPRVHALRAALRDLGCGPVLDELMVDPPPDTQGAADRLSYAFATTVIEHLDSADARLAGYTATELTRSMNQLIAADENLRSANASRVRRAAAERLVAALDSHPNETAVLQGQVKRKRGFKPLRQLVAEAPNVILAAKPVWAASPQTVSQLLPTQVLFDVVLFDEASQVLPAAALPSIARGRQVVAAGDDLQLPPTTLFTRTAELDLDPSNLDVIEEGDEASDPSIDHPSAPPPALAEIPDTESLLDALSVKLGPQRSRYLAWHYRSRDEKLIATSNTFLYRPRGRMMTTFPAADSADALALVQCEPSPGLGTTNLSPVGEVRSVVDLMLAHAAEQVGQQAPLSLGVIAFGSKHAARIEREFDQRIVDQPPEVQAYFAEGDREQMFIKNIERVQGDERDVIILSVGYARGTDGRLRYNWGPVLTDGGHRRVNVAITRARQWMRLVTSFGVADVDPTASAMEGFELMYRFLRFAASGGADFGDTGPMHVPCNPFEADIQMNLERRGLQVVPQWGVGGYRLDFAVRDPRQPGRFLLAVEADGASYHSGLVVRERDRLRQRQLEARGWRFVRIWSSDYFFDPNAEIDRVVRAYEDALAGSAGVDRGTEEPSTQGGARDVPNWTEAPAARGRRPSIARGYPISKYSDRELQALVRWVLSDNLPHTRADVFEEVKRDLGFERDGKVIVVRISAAVGVVMEGQAR